MYLRSGLTGVWQSIICGLSVCLSPGAASIRGRRVAARRSWSGLGVRGLGRAPGHLRHLRRRNLIPRQTLVFGQAPPFIDTLGLVNLGDLPAVGMRICPARDFSDLRRASVCVKSGFSTAEIALHDRADLRSLGFEVRVVFLLAAFRLPRRRVEGESAIFFSK